MFCVYFMRCWCVRLDVVIKVENRGVEGVEKLDINMAIPEKGPLLFVSV